MDGWLKQKPSKHPRRASFCCLPRVCHASEGDMHREDEGLMGLRALLPGCASLRAPETVCNSLRPVPGTDRNDNQV